jgi:hypothetical protein
MGKRLGKALITTGTIISIGFNVADAIKLGTLGLPVSAWTAIGLIVAFIGIGALIHRQQQESAALQRQLGILIDEQAKGLRLQPLTATDKIETKNEIRPDSWKGLSEAEFAQVELAVISMKVHHGHVDYDGLIDDQRKGKPLNGSCWRCGKPRFQKGDPPK